MPEPTRSASIPRRFGGPSSFLNSAANLDPRPSSWRSTRAAPETPGASSPAAAATMKELTPSIGRAAARISEPERFSFRRCRTRRVDLPLRNLHRLRSETFPRRSRHAGAPMIVPCIDLMGGKVVQLVQGREKALEADPPLAMLEKFRAFTEIQVIDLDAATGDGENSAIVAQLASRAKCRVGGGVRTAERARALVGQGAYRIIVGTAAFTPSIEAISSAADPKE